MLLGWVFVKNQPTQSMLDIYIFSLCVSPGVSATLRPSAPTKLTVAQARQKLQQMQQQLSLGQQQLRELQKQPNQQAKVGVAVLVAVVLPTV